MAKSRPFAYNTGTTISGTDQCGSIAIGVTSQDYSINPGGVKWWMGPDESTQYIIAQPVSGMTQPTPVSGVTAGIGFYGSGALTDPSFLSVVNSIAREKGQTPFGTVSDASTWLSINNYWTTYVYVAAYLKYKLSYLSALNTLTGTYWNWGFNTHGRLGTNSLVNQCTPVSVLGAQKTFCEIIAGFAIDNRGQLWGWGYNTYSQGGFGAGDKSTPVSIWGAKKTFCKLASTGTFHALDYKGAIWSWGFAPYGQVGNNTAAQTNTPTKIYGNKTFCTIGPGGADMAIDNYGQLWTWGYNAQGQVGDNTIINKCTPVSVMGAKKTFCKIFGIGNTSHALDNYGQIWSWGYNLNGELGNNSTVSQKTPVSILGAKKTFCQIGGSSAIDYHGQVWCWGDNTAGNAGDNTTTNRSTPVSILGAKKTFCTIYGSMGVDVNGYVWAWGANTSYTLGNNTNTSKLTPVRVCTL